MIANVKYKKILLRLDYKFLILKLISSYDIYFFLNYPDNRDIFLLKTFCL